MGKFIEVIDRDNEGVERRILYPWDASTQAPITNAFNIQTVYSETVTLTDAQIKTLPTTPITVVPAPGEGFAVFPVSASIIGNNMAAVYTNKDATAQILISMGAGELTVLAPGDAYYLGDNADEWFGDCPPLLAVPEAAGQATGYGYYRDQIENKAISVWASNGALGNLTGGNAANSMQVTVHYKIITLP
jgi:hypothetical protein